MKKTKVFNVHKASLNCNNFTATGEIHNLTEPRWKKKICMENKEPLEMFIGFAVKKHKQGHVTALHKNRE